MQEQEAAEIIWQKRAEIIHSSTSKMDVSLQSCTWVVLQQQILQAC